MKGTSKFQASKLQRNIKRPITGGGREWRFMELVRLFAVLTREEKIGDE